MCSKKVLGSAEVDEVRRRGSRESGGGDPFPHLNQNNSNIYLFYRLGSTKYFVLGEKGEVLDLKRSFRITELHRICPDTLSCDYRIFSYLERRAAEIPGLKGS